MNNTRARELGVQFRDSSQRLSENFLPNVLANVLADEPLGSFGEGHLIREAAFEKHTNGRMFMHVGGRN